MKWDRSFLITLIYSLFISLFTIYILSQRTHKSSHWGSYLEVQLAGNYAWFISQGFILRSKNWGLLLLLPLAILALSILIGYLFVGLLRLGGGGGTLLDHDNTDMILMTLLILTGSYFCLRFIRPKKTQSRQKKSHS